MAFTRPTADQLVFRSSNNGIQNLDAYLEATELGGRTLGDLLSDIFDASGNFATSAFEFRLEDATRSLQVRVGTFSDANTGWTSLGTVFKPVGVFTAGVDYNVMDVVGDGTDLYLVKEAITSSDSISTSSQFIASSKTFRILTGDSVSAASQYATAAAASVATTGGHVTATQDARDLALAYASGTPSDGTLSAKTYRDQASGFRDEIFNSSAFSAVSADLQLSSSDSVLKQVETDLTDITTLVSGVVTGSNPSRTNLADLNSVAANMANVTTVVGLSTAMSDINAFSTQITAVGNDFLGSQSINAVATVTSAISTIGADLALNATSEIRKFNDGLSATIDNLTINGVAKGAVYQDTGNLNRFDLTQANNFFLDMANHASFADATTNAVELVFLNAHLCNNMQPFTISIKQDGAFNNSGTSPAPALSMAGTNIGFRYPNGVAPAFTTTGTDIITISGYVLDPETVNNTATIVIGHMVNS